jgi:bacterial/archaeal transporter family protein
MRPELYALIASILFGVGGYFEKKGLHLGNLSPQMGITVRTATAVIILAIISYTQWKSLPKAGTAPILYLVIGGGVMAGALGLLSMYTAIANAPLTRVMPIAFTAPLFTAIMAMTIGGEPFDWRVFFGMLMTVGGIVVITTA